MTHFQEVLLVIVYVIGLTLLSIRHELKRFNDREEKDKP
jgi:hypothetical protein